MRPITPSGLALARMFTYVRTYKNKCAITTSCLPFTPRRTTLAVERLYNTSQPKKSSDNDPKKHISDGSARVTVFVASIGLFAGLASYNWSTITSTFPIFDTSANQLEPNKFCAYRLASKSPVSSTSSLFCLQNESMQCANPELEQLWEEGIWSVEIKQPEIMIVRSYTPLPPVMRLEGSSSSTKMDRLHFLIRKERQGEVSGYLHRLSQSAQVEVRGPYLEYKLPSDLDELVFIAGGTGIAPAMQVAYALAQRPEGSTKMKLIWANRTREDTYGLSSSDAKQSIVSQLEALESSMQNKMNTKLFIDEDKTFISKNDISSVLQSQHNTRTHPMGRKLILISGPDGFVEYVSGAKRLINGQETQGSIGGLLAQNDLSGWEVWKL